MNASGPKATNARRIVPGTGIPVDPADRQLWWADREAYADPEFSDLDQRRQYLDGQRRQLQQAADDVVRNVGTKTRPGALPGADGAAGAPEGSRLSVALAATQAGWPVIPLRPRTKKRRTGKEDPKRPNTLPSLEEGRVRWWWGKWPDAEVGVVISEQLVVVLDPDGPVGRASLQKLIGEAGLTELPETFTVTTGRADGGQHRWYRLPAGAAKLKGQYGSDYPATVGLDVLFNGLVVAPGCLHKSGRMYTSDRPIPRIEELAELPAEMYDVLRRRGKLKDDPPDSVRRRGAAASGETQRSKRSRASEESEELHGPDVWKGLPRSVRRMLHDTSDGRNLRTLEVCTRLIWAGLSDEQITEVVLDAPLGDKAREQYSPKDWLQQKLDKAREFEPDLKHLDKDGYFESVLRQVESSSKVRVLHSLLLRSSTSGVVTKSLAEIGIDSATNSMSSVKELLQAGWLEVVTPGSKDSATTYRLTSPDDLRQGEPTVSTPPPPLPICLLGSPGRRSFPPDHDAFRSAKGSANAAYPVLCTLTGEPQTESQLAAWLPVTRTPRTLQARLKMLSKAGLAVRTDEGWTLTTKPVGPLLDVVAEQCGTAGKRKAAIDAHRKKCAEWDEQRYQAGVPGSDIWLMIRKKRAMTKIENGHYDRVLQDTGMTPDELAEHLARAEYDLMQRADGTTVQKSPVRRLQTVPEAPNVLDRVMAGNFTNVPQVNVLHLPIGNALRYPAVHLWPTLTGHLANSA